MFYNIDKRIGKQVWVWGAENLNQDKVWIVESLHEPDETHYDYYFTLVCGEETMESYWYETVVLPEDNEDEVSRIWKYFTDNGFYCEDVYDDEILDTPLIRVNISWGDWKHDHGWCETLMKHLGYEEFNCIVTEENGSDCYSAEHIFVRKDAEKLALLKNLQKIFS